MHLLEVRMYKCYIYAMFQFNSKLRVERSIFKKMDNTLLHFWIDVPSSNSFSTHSEEICILFLKITIGSDITFETCSSYNDKLKNISEKIYYYALGNMKFLSKMCFK